LEKFFCIVVRISFTKSTFRKYRERIFIAIQAKIISSKSLKIYQMKLKDCANFYQ